ncbi:hypothetical protein [Thaumasiovibrio sp. DFM-14]|uniref:hypothetical protein n=1 Tax=Thaumasiovibrio sp. DFM-14 TaxID=3384792 RepID=UPI00399F73BE
MERKRITKSKSFLTLPLGKVKMTVGCTVGVFFVLLGVIIWLAVANSNYNDRLLTHSLISQQAAEEQQALIMQQEIKIADLELAVSDAALIIARKNEHLADERDALEQVQQALASAQAKLKKQDQRIVSLKANYQRNLKKQTETQRLQLAQQQNQLDMQRSKLKAQEEEVSKKISAVDEWEQRKEEFETLYAESARQANNEKRVNQLMTKFDRLRVDLDVINECDKDYLYRYNEAKSVLSHMLTFIQKYEMESDFYFFVISNDSAITAQNRKLCLRN